MPYSNIDKSSDHFNVVKWTGTAYSPVDVTGFGHNPDFIWNKYAAGAGDHQQYDSVRGATKMHVSNSTNAESTNANGVTAFITDGFTAGSDINVNGGISIAHGWKANGAGSSNTDGDITSTVSANTTAGFSIIKFTGNGSTSQSFGHGLTGTPKFWIIKNLSTSSNNWQVYFEGTDRLKLDTNEATSTNSAYLMSANATTITTPSNSDSAWGNGSGNDYIVYAYEEIPGFSKFGKYRTNNSVTDGPFIYTGHKPKFIIAKNMSASGYNWVMWNSALNPRNQAQFFHHHPNTNDSWVDNTNMIDILSNGFRLKDYQTATNGGGDTILYISFAEAPLVGSNNVPCTAR
jgi:hypothetical protein